MRKNSFYWALSALVFVLVAAGCDEDPSNNGADGDAIQESDTDAADTESVTCTEDERSCDDAWMRSCQGGVWVRITDCANSGQVCAQGACQTNASDGDESEKEADADTDADATDNDPNAEQDSEFLDGDSDSEAAETTDGDTVDLAEREEEFTDNETAEADSESETDAETAVDADSDTEADAETSDADSELEKEAETEAPCSDGPCCENGQWLEVGALCRSGGDPFACTRDTCDAAHACSEHTLLPGKCLIEESCYEAWQSAPGRPCLWCNAAEPLVWGAKPTSEACDDDNACSYGEMCDGRGACTPGTKIACISATDACGTRSACNGTDSCTIEFPDALTSCEPDTLSCTDDLCDGNGRCEHRRRTDTCLIEGVCYTQHALNPANECQWCDASQNAWAAKAGADGCTDDGNLCTTDVCAGGECTHPPKGSGTSCDDGLFCNGVDVCDGDGLCRHAGDPCFGGGRCADSCTEDQRNCYASPFTPCRDATGACDLAASCDGAGTCPANTCLEDGASCGTNDQCYQGSCVDCINDAGCALTPDDGLPCTEAVCNTATHACIQNLSAHFTETCGDGSTADCDDADSCDADGVCRPNNRPATTNCDDNDPCTLNDHCDGNGLCAAGTPQTCNEHGNCQSDGRCECQAAFAGEGCQSCAENYWDYPACKPKVLDMSTGSNFTCALLATGAVQCWGRNDYGQLGDGTTVNRLSPTTVVGLSAGVVQLSVGGYHACALLSSGTVMCWGWNYHGMLGGGTVSKSYSTPIQAGGLSGSVLSIQSGGYHTCALMANGGVKCWGDNEYGQLGNDVDFYSIAPKDVTGLISGAVQLSSGSRHACAILAGTGVVKCWGRNDKGQLGDLTTTDRKTPGDVVGLGGTATMVDAGFDSTCTVLASGAIRCWGNNADGGLGDGTTVDSLMPVTVSGIDTAQKVETNSETSCALLVGGGVACWGSQRTGCLGNGGYQNSLVPVAVWGLQSGVTRLSTSYGHACVVLDGQGAKCWGNNVLGELGNRKTVASNKPVDVVW